MRPLDVGQWEIITSSLEIVLGCRLAVTSLILIQNRSGTETHKQSNIRCNEGIGMDRKPNRVIRSGYESATETTTAEGLV